MQPNHSRTFRTQQEHTHMQTIARPTQCNQEQPEYKFQPAGHILRRCHIALHSAFGYQQSHRLRYHRLHTHTRHGILKEQTAMLAIVRNMVEFFVLALINMHRSTEGASHNLVHQLMLYVMLSLKGISTSISLHTMLTKTCMPHTQCRLQAFFAWTCFFPFALGQSHFMWPALPHK